MKIPLGQSKSKGGILEWVLAKFAHDWPARSFDELPALLRDKGYIRGYR